MSGETKIEWATHTWNPTTGCDRVSPGCDNCYALTMAKRLKAMGSARYQRDGDPATSGPGFGLSVHPDALDWPLRKAKPMKVFVNSMSDLFHAEVPDEFIARVWAVMESGPGARPMHPAWARSLRDQCDEAGVAFHFKQWGSHDEHGTPMNKHEAGRILDGRTWDEFPTEATA